MVSTDQKKINRYYSVLPRFMYDGMMDLPDIVESRASLIQNLDIRASDRVLEVACGTGINFEHYPAGPEYHAIDINPYMLARARKRAEITSTDVSLYRGDAHTLPFPNNSFDIVISTFGLSAIPDNNAAFSDIERVVSNDGRIGLIDFDSSTPSPTFEGQVGLDLHTLLRRSVMDVVYFQTALDHCCGIILEGSKAR